MCPSVINWRHHCDTLDLLVAARHINRYSERFTGCGVPRPSFSSLLCLFTDVCMAWRPNICLTTFNMSLIPITTVSGHRHHRHILSSHVHSFHRRQSCLSAGCQPLHKHFATWRHLNCITCHVSETSQNSPLHTRFLPNCLQQDYHTEITVIKNHVTDTNYTQYL